MSGKEQLLQLGSDLLPLALDQVVGQLEHTQQVHVLVWTVSRGVPNRGMSAAFTNRRRPIPPLLSLTTPVTSPLSRCTSNRH
jgi:hypothetical protein